MNIITIILTTSFALILMSINIFIGLDTLIIYGKKHLVYVFICFLMSIMTFVNMLIDLGVI